MKFIFPTKVYDLLKWITLILLPALSTLYLALSQVWPLPHPNEIVGTLAAIDVFLGVLLGISTNNYHKTGVLAPMASIRAAWVLSDDWYAILRWTVQIALPAAATLYFTIAKIWGLPNADQVVASIMALDTFLGMLLQFSMAQFNRTAIPAFIG